MASLWRWLLVPPAFVAGFIPGFIPGIVARLTWDGGSSGMPWSYFVDSRILDVTQAALDGYCVILFAAMVAPRLRLATAVVAASLMLVVVGGLLAWNLVGGGTYYGDVLQGMSIVWDSALSVITMIASVAAVFTIKGLHLKVAT